MHTPLPPPDARHTYPPPSPSIAPIQPPLSSQQHTCPQFVPVQTSNNVVHSCGTLLWCSLGVRCCCNHHKSQACAHEQHNCIGSTTGHQTSPQCSAPWYAMWLKKYSTCDSINKLTGVSHCHTYANPPSHPPTATLPPPALLHTLHPCPCSHRTPSPSCTPTQTVPINTSAQASYAPASDVNTSPQCEQSYSAQ